MAKEVQCPHCQTAVQAPDDAVTLKCSNCNKTFELAAIRETQCLVEADVPRASGTDNTRLARDHGVESPSSSPDKAKRYGPYAVSKMLGKGAMGVVFQATDTRLGREVALKIMRGASIASEERKRRFQQEAIAAAKLKHPNIVAIHDVGETTDGDHYFVMDVVEGDTLDEWLKAQPRTTVQRIQVLEKIARAVAYAHGQGIVHRDLKPENIVVEKQSGEPKIMDFGLARLSEQESSLTQSGDIVGTPLYMSPEQAKGNVREIDERADVYSLGAILYELLAGNPPFEAESVLALVSLVATSEPVPPRRIDPNIDRDLETICLKCLEKEKERRYRTAAALAEDLARFLKGELIAARPASILYRTRKKLRRHRGLVASVALGLVAGLTGLGFWLRAESRRKLEAAERENAEARAGVLEKQITETKAQEEKRWETVFTDEFSGEKLAPHWIVKEGEWSLKDGQLNGDATARKGVGALVLLERDLRGDLKVRFEAVAGPEGNREIGLCVFTTEKEPGTSGYFVSFQPEGLRIDRGKTTVWRMPEKRLEPGRRYAIRFEREGDRVRLYIGAGEKPTAEFTDWAPPASVEHRFLGFNTWSGRVSITHLEVQQASLPLRASPLDLAEYLRSRGQYNEAVQLLDKFSRDSKEAAMVENALLVRAQCLEQSGEQTAAQAAYTDLLKRFPSEGNTFRQACARLRAGEPAEGILKELAAAYPSSTSWRDVAVLLIDKLLESTSRPPSRDLEGEIRSGVATAVVCAERTGDPAARKKALASVSRVCALFLFIRLPSGESKLWILEKAAACDPTNTLCWYHWGWELMKQERFPEAIDKFRKATECDPEYTLAWHKWGWVLLYLGHPQDALEKLQKATECDPTYVNAWNNWADALVQLGRYEEALEKYRRITECNPKLAPAWGRWGWALICLGRYQEALEKCQRAAECAPNEPNVLVNVAWALEGLDRFEEAIQTCAKVNEADPKNQECRALGAYCLVRCDKAHDADAAFAQALKDARTPGEKALVFYLQGRGFTLQGRKADAATAFREARNATSDTWLKDRLTKLLKEVER